MLEKVINFFSSSKKSEKLAKIQEREEYKQKYEKLKEETKNDFIIDVYEHKGQVYIFTLSKYDTGYLYGITYFEELPSLKTTFDVSPVEIGKLVQEASKRVRNYQFEENPYTREELLSDIGAKKWITFINKCRHCGVSSFYQKDREVRIAPRYRSVACSFLSGEELIANIDDPQEIGEKVLQALKVYEPKYPLKKKKK